MTKDLAILVGPDQAWMTTEQFFEAIRANLEKAMASSEAAAGLSPASGERTRSRRTPRPIDPAGNAPQQRDSGRASAPARRRG